jgi:hypothetical protein
LARPRSSPGYSILPQFFVGTAAHDSELAAGAFCGESLDRALGRDSSAGPGQTTHSAFWRCRALRIILLKSPQSPHGPVASIGDENASCAPAYIREGERHEASV